MFLLILMLKNIKVMAEILFLYCLIGLKSKSINDKQGIILYNIHIVEYINWEYVNWKNGIVYGNIDYIE